MKRFISYPSINQFRNVIKEVSRAARYVGFNEETQKPIYDNRALPVINATATEKIHGTNAAVCYSNPDGFWVQSRKNIITPEIDNAACAFHAQQNMDVWTDIIKDLANEYSIDLNKYIVSVYFEWAGGSIQSHSALTGLDKHAIIFRHFKVSPLEPGTDEAAYWQETVTAEFDYSDGIERVVLFWVDYPDANIFNISSFPTYDIEIDFNEPQMSQNSMIKLVEETIELNSPVGQQFGIDGNVGEGIVVSFMYKDNMHSFKVKGERHSKSKVKTLKPVDEEKLQKIQDCAQHCTPAWRLEQMFSEANDTINENEPTIKNMGTFLKLLNKDILKEEADFINAAGLEPKAIFGKTSQIARNWYQEQLDAAAG